MKKQTKSQKELIAQSRSRTLSPSEKDEQTRVMQEMIAEEEMKVQEIGLVTPRTENSDIDDDIVEKADSFANFEQEIKANEKASEMMPPEIYVLKWVDYTRKYGVGYMLSSHLVGVLFNDLHSIIQTKKGFKSIKKDPESGIEERVSFTADKCPPELEKKYGLYRWFQRYLKSSEHCARSKLIAAQPDEK